MKTRSLSSLLIAGAIFLLLALPMPARGQTAVYTWDITAGRYDIQLNFFNRPLDSVLVGNTAGITLPMLKQMGSVFYFTASPSINEEHNVTFSNLGRSNRVGFANSRIGLRNPALTARTIPYVVATKPDGSKVKFFIKTPAFQAYLGQTYSNGQAMTRSDGQNFDFKMPTTPAGSRVKIDLFYDKAKNLLSAHVVTPGTQPYPFFLRGQASPILFLGFEHFYLSGGEPWWTTEFYPFKQDVWLTIRAFRKPVLRFNLILVDVDNDMDYSFLDITKADCTLSVNGGAKVTVPRVKDAFQINLP